MVAFTNKPQRLKADTKLMLDDGHAQRPSLTDDWETQHMVDLFPPKMLKLWPHDQYTKDLSAVSCLAM